MKHYKLEVKQRYKPYTHEFYIGDLDEYFRGRIPQVARARGMHEIKSIVQNCVPEYSVHYQYDNSFEVTIHFSNYTYCRVVATEIIT